MSFFFCLPRLCWLIACLLVSSSVLATGEEHDTTVSKKTFNEQQKEAIEAALAAVKRQDFAEAVARFTPLAEAGNAEAEHNLAMLYRDGKGVKKDLAASARWFRRAAEQGLSDAQFYLGYLYDKGEGVTRSQHYAVVWYRKAAEQGHGLAQINLGVSYANGSGVVQDLEQAYIWFHLAATQGYKAALEDKQLIKETLQEQGWDNARLDALEQRARKAYQLYVQPFKHIPSPHSHRLQPPGPPQSTFHSTPPASPSAQ